MNTIIDEEYEAFLIKFVQEHPVFEAARILKLQEEVGEAAEAFLSFSSAHWRKENGASTWDVCMELADVAMTAMVAMVALGYGPDQMLQAQQEKTFKRIEGLCDNST